MVKSDLTTYVIDFQTYNFPISRLLAEVHKPSLAVVVPILALAHI